QLACTLQHDDIDIGVCELRLRHTGHSGHARRRLLIGHDQFVADAGECVHPSAVHVPDQDPHTGTSSRVSASTASAISSGTMVERQGWPGTGHSRARVPRHAEPWSPRIRVGTPCGAQRSADTTGEKRLTTGVPTAAARWAGPVLPTMIAA